MFYSALWSHIAFTALVLSVISPLLQGRAFRSTSNSSQIIASNSLPIVDRYKLLKTTLVPIRSVDLLEKILPGDNRRMEM
ncbi:hypothetical protein M441DRAFT_155859, partial [Trichoderma asperellum CBS 433.97]